MSLTGLPIAASPIAFTSQTAGNTYNESMSGGVFVAGAAGNQQNSNNSGSSGGTVGSSAVVYEVINHTAAAPAGVVCDGSAPVTGRQSNYFYTMTGSVVMLGDAGALLHEHFFPCADRQVPCLVFLHENDDDCPRMDFYYDPPDDPLVPTRTRGLGAYLPAITKCRQPVTKVRRRPRPQPPPP